MAKMDCELDSSTSGSFSTRFIPFEKKLTKAELSVTDIESIKNSMIRLYV
jgi:hypothetical protein